MMLVLLVAVFGANALSPANLLDQAFRGRRGSRWSGTVLVERPGRDVPDTALACREGTSERLDFRDGSLWMTGDSTVFLRTKERSAIVLPRHHMPPPPDGNVKIVGQAKVLGRPVLVLELVGPGGHGRRVWMDTSLPAVLKGEPIGKDDHLPPERQFLAIRPGVGCPPNSFQIPAGWTVRQGGGPPEGGEERRHGRRHEAASLSAMIAEVGFEPPPPPWMPAGFSAKNWAWVETREGKAAQIFYANGEKNISIFWRPADGPPPYCPKEGCRDRKGQAVVFGHVGKLGMAVTGNIPPEDLERVAGLRK
jgi:hypothetical protein